MVAWSLRICFRLRVCGRLPLSIRPTKLRKLRSLLLPRACCCGQFCALMVKQISVLKNLCFSFLVSSSFFLLSCDLQFFWVIEESRVFSPFLRVSRRFLFFSFLHLGSKKIVVGDQVWWVLSYLRVSVNGS